MVKKVLKAESSTMKDQRFLIEASTFKIESYLKNRQVSVKCRNTLEAFGLKGVPRSRLRIEKQHV
jgi:hypothetical protein